MYDVLVIGGGPAGIAAAVTASNQSSVILVERENRIGGILNQCIHEGFGLIKYGERLTGTEYAALAEKELNNSTVKVLSGAFITTIKRESENIEDGFCIEYVNSDGVGQIKAKKIVLATGCRERTAKQIFVGGNNIAGILTAGTAQHYINLMGLMPTKRCIILGSGDIGLIMARRLTLEGATVLGVFEAKKEVGGLTRNVVQCLEDFNIPLYLQKTVTRVFGVDRVESVEVCSVDDNGTAILESAERIDCDAVILSVGLIPENEIAKKIGIKLCVKTKGPNVDQTLMTDEIGVYCCGNSLHVNDLVDYVSESGYIAGGYASSPLYPKDDCEVQIDDKFSYVVPQRINNYAPKCEVIFYLRVKQKMLNQSISIWVNGLQHSVTHYARLLPPEMIRIESDLSKYGKINDIKIKLEENRIKIS
ncbi:MAG: FAD-dependent oxidoreductase [Clostridia bacterium]